MLCLMGPTASGKTVLGVTLARNLNCEIISVDSAMVYQGMDIGTAKPTLEEQCGIMHHLIDILDPAESFSTGQFRQRALALIDEIHERGKMPLLVGGTMLYFRALQHGLAELPAANPEVRRNIDEQGRNLGWSAMHARLQAIDPVAAARIHPNDPQRIQRALEVYEITGKSLTELCEASPQLDLPFRMVNLVLMPGNRNDLHERIKTRFIDMLERGLIEEVKSMIDRGDLNANKPAVRAVGYRQVWSYLHGEFDKNTMVERGIIATRQLAKRQMTWLRKESSPYIYRTGNANLQNLIMRDLEPFVL